MFRNKRLFIAALIAALIAGLFWSQSRIPALSEKAQMGVRTSFGDIAFEIALPVSESQSLPVRIFRTAVNWGFTNLEGMLFGLLFAAAILTLIANLPSRQFKRPWQNAISGIFIGAPMGVCVNCATPIAFGIYAAGARLETALSSLFASPSLNVIVLTMSFTLLPWEIATAKLAGVLVLLFCVPFLVGRVVNVAKLDAESSLGNGPTLPLPPQISAVADNTREPLVGAFVQTTKIFVLNFLYLARFALPLMVLAGILGAAVIEVIPFEYFGGVKFGLGVLIVAAIVATLLPVPIALDVIVVVSLLASGIDAGIATAMLFALGIFSVYPAAMIARYVSVKLSAIITSCVVLIAVILGLSMHTYFEQKNRAELNEITIGLSSIVIETYRQAVAVCDEVPEHLQMACFTQHVAVFDSFAAKDEVCATRPRGLSVAYCNHVLQRHRTTSSAKAAGDSKLCFDLPEASARTMCSYTVVQELVQKEHDIGRCDDLLETGLVRRCREDYLNVSLLFNPDGSACESLPDKEAEICRVNAAVYRYADTLNFTGCETLDPQAARDHCRYTIASTMIGRNADASGCDQIEAPELATKCRSLPAAWQAMQSQSFEQCATLPVDSLRDTCWLRVADVRIEKILARSIDVARQGTTLLAQQMGQARPAEARGVAPEIDWQGAHNATTGSEQITVEFARYRDKSDQFTGSFRKVSAAEMGIGRSWNFRATDFFEPFIIGKGIASGDFNNDTWPDLVLASEAGVLLYRNIGGQFELVDVEQGELGSANVFAVALVDADNDGLQDIFASAYGGDNYLLINVDGQFEQSQLQKIDGSERLAMSVGFADLDKDGELDIALGNWSSGVEKFFSADDSANVILYRQNGRYRKQRLVGAVGETNTLLLADVDGDNVTDLVAGNDRLVPDMYYLGVGEGESDPLLASDLTIPLTSMFTMSIESADFNNDLYVDIFSTDMTFAPSSRDSYCAAIAGLAERTRCDDLLRAFTVIREKGAASCDTIDSSTVDRNDCYIAFSIAAAKKLQDTQYCEDLGEQSSAMVSLCEHLASASSQSESTDQDRYPLQGQRNTLLLGSAEGFVERAKSFGIESSFWSWNAKSADLDNDGWQDIYVGNGFHFGENFYEVQENVLFRNIGGERFEQVQDVWGLNDPINTPSYTYLDVDLDGDLDIIATGVMASPRAYINELQVGNAVSVVLRDERGNSSSIAAKVSVYYGGAENLQQRKENKLSGGFLSFDNPVLYFGIAEHAIVDRVMVRWPDGEESTISGPLAAGGQYRISRSRQE